jgi:hypothetical protein
MPYTREDLERVIAEGGSVMLPGGALVTDRNHLPSQESLDTHHQQVARLNEEGRARYPELRPEVMFPAGTAEPTPGEPESPAFNLDRANKAELLAEAERRGIEVPADATKQDLKDALSAV